ncbi:BRD4-interacting chromatin-remodeling complex-associated protein-like [Macrobrachium nipponense]|uniref:BRD4-interacting chromatin-remodeling complex-associated protein-like n=1 Tax=Macrobrachium nipponense TaxID=159736 RepID=UPI0030C893AE
MPAPGLPWQTLWPCPLGALHQACLAEPSGPARLPAPGPAWQKKDLPGPTRLPAPGGLLGRPCGPPPPACTGPLGMHRGLLEDLRPNAQPACHSGLLGRPWVARPRLHRDLAWQTITAAPPLGALHRAALARPWWPAACPLHQACLETLRPGPRLLPRNPGLLWQDLGGPHAHLPAPGLLGRPSGPPACPHQQTLWPALACLPARACLADLRWPARLPAPGPALAYLAAPRPPPALPTGLLWQTLQALPSHACTRACLADLAACPPACTAWPVLGQTLWPARLPAHRALLGRTLVAPPGRLPAPGPSRQTFPGPPRPSLLWARAFGRPCGRIPAWPVPRHASADLAGCARLGVPACNRGHALADLCWPPSRLPGTRPALQDLGGPPTPACPTGHALAELLVAPPRLPVPGLAPADLPGPPACLHRASWWQTFVDPPRPLALHQASSAEPSGPPDPGLHRANAWQEPCGPACLPVTRPDSAT